MKVTQSRCLTNLIGMVLVEIKQAYISKNSFGLETHTCGDRQERESHYFTLKTPKKSTTAEACNCRI